MSDDELFMPRLLIEPEPTPQELLAMLLSMRPAAVEDSVEMPASHWSEAARWEQLRSPLDDRRTGWNS